MSKLIIKINVSSLLEGSALNLRYIQIFCQTVANLASSNHQLAIVSPIPSSNHTLSDKASEAVVKVELLSAYRDMFAEYNQTIALCDTTEAQELMKNHIIPIIFANSPVDAAHISIVCGADKLIILTDSDGIFNSDPAKNPNSTIIREIHEITPALLQIIHATDEISAAKVALQANIETLLINGNNPENIARVASGAIVGTKFSPTPQAPSD